MIGYVQDHDGRVRDELVLTTSASQRCAMIARALSYPGVIPVVVDTNVFVAALLKRGGTSRRVIRACLSGAYQPLMGAALLAEYEDLLSRDALWKTSLVSASEREAVLDGLLSVCRWTEVYFAWRPNLPDEADNHLIELAVAGSAAAIVTRNIRDLATGELRFEGLQILTPEQCLEAYPCRL